MQTTSTPDYVADAIHANENFCIVCRTHGACEHYPSTSATTGPFGMTEAEYAAWEDGVTPDTSDHYPSTEDA